MKRIALGICMALAFAGGVQAKGNAEKGKLLSLPQDDKNKDGKGCAACHGPQGDKPLQADYPVLAGQHNDYLVRALTDYKSGRRNNAVMKGMAASLSKQDIEDLAAWFASQKSHLHDQR